MFVGDLHFSESPPIARSVEEDWPKVQEGYVTQLSSLYFKHGNPPIFIAGDIFNKWNSSAYIISMVIHWFRCLEVYAIPGNHDLPEHNYDQLKKSAYYTLVAAGVIKDLNAGFMREVGDIQITGFPSGYEVQPYKAGNSLMMNVALIHDYIWTEKTGYDGAAEEKRLGNCVKKLSTYDVAVFGDNHKGFLWENKDKNLTVYNCGTFMRRHSDEQSARPCVGLLYNDGRMSRHYLDVSKDKFLDSENIVGKLEKGLEIDLSGFTEELQTLHAEKRDFVKVVLRWLDGNQPLTEGVKSVIKRALGVKNA